LFTASITSVEYLKVEPFFLLHTSPSRANNVELIVKKIVVAKINRNKFVL